MLLNEIHESVTAMLAKLVAAGEYRVYISNYVAQLQQELADRLESQHCLLASSGTAALEIALRGGGVGPGDEVVLSAYDYPGNFWAIDRVGATPVLVDTLPNSWRISLEQLQLALQNSPKCKAVIASHLHGEMQDVVSLRRLCDQYERLFIEDCCQALGAKIGEHPAGSYGDVAVVSFGGGKLLSAGRGGGMLTSIPELAQRCRIAAGAGSGPYLMSEVQAAIVLAQLPWLNQINEQCCEYFLAVNRLFESKATDAIGWHLPYLDQLQAKQSALYQAGWLLGPSNRSVEPDQRQASRPSTREQKTRVPKTALSMEPEGDIFSSAISQIMDQAEALDVGHRRYSVGRGFPGFHRRSKRRCRVLTELTNVSATVARTLVVHHRVALEEQIRPDELALELLQGMTYSKG